jgi:aldose 1-epimerase
MTHEPNRIVWLERDEQRLGLLPGLGGSVAAWFLDRSDRVDLWRPWDGQSDDRYTFASFPLVPWSNRISGGGFDSGGRFHPIRPNRAGEPYPIHGDAWLQAWECEPDGAAGAIMRLASQRFDGDPYVYAAEQRFRLVEGGLDQTLSVTHQGNDRMPYGLGVHPYFLRDAHTRLVAPVRGVWLAREDRLPTVHSADFPPTWDLRDAPATGLLIDNVYTGWSGEAQLRWPTLGLELSLRCIDVIESGGNGHCLLYRPPTGPFFCFEPISHPVDAFHLPGRPGLRELGPGESMALHLQWRFAPLV